MCTEIVLNVKNNFCTQQVLAQKLRKTYCEQKLFLTFRTISVHNMFSPCSAKRRASDKDLPVTCQIAYLIKALALNPLLLLAVRTTNQLHSVSSCKFLSGFYGEKLDKFHQN